MRKMWCTYLNFDVPNGQLGPESKSYALQPLHIYVVSGEKLNIWINIEQSQMKRVFKQCVGSRYKME